jgi:hypothetical protein
MQMSKRKNFQQVRRQVRRALNRSAITQMSGRKLNRIGYGTGYSNHYARSETKELNDE